MTKNNPLTRPAMSAIAAFLVLSSHNAFAQTAPAGTAPPVADPIAPTVMVPQVTPTIAPVRTTSAPTSTTTQPGPIIRVPLDLDPVPAPVAKAEARPVAKAAAKPAPVARRDFAEPATATPAAALTFAPLAADPAATPLVEEGVVPAAPMVDPAPGPIAPTVASYDPVPWELVGGGAALLILGGAGLAFGRRRRTRGSMQATGDYPTVLIEPTMAREPETAASTERRTPSFAAAPSGSMGRHEAMALAGPSADNPFVTLKKRLKRARFYDRKDRFEYSRLVEREQEPARHPVSAWEIANRPAPAPAIQQQAARGPGQRPVFPGRLRPGFAGS